MLRVTLKGLLGHKLRLLLTAMAIVLGVSFVSGTLVLGDTLNATFDKLFATAYSGTDVGVRGKSAFSVDITEGGDAGQARPPVEAGLVPRLQQVDGVAEVAGDNAGFAQLVAPDGQAVETSGAPTIGGAWLGTSPLNPYQLVDGEAPSSAGEVAVDRATAESADIGVGDRVGVLTAEGSSRAEVTGLVTLGEGGSLAGATITLFDAQTAARVLTEPGTYTEVLLVGDGSVSDAELRDRVADVIPPRYEALTGEQLADDAAGEIQEGLSFFSIFLLVFAFISVFVGSFIIFNTFTMLVAQRSRELALLRALGASRSQVNRMVVGESFVVGLVGSTIGLGLGVLLSVGLKAVIDAFLGDLPASGLVFQPRTAVVAYVVGLVVTVLAAVVPARKATRIPPVAAMRDDVVLPSASLRRRALVGGLTLVVGAAAMAAALLGEAALWVLGLGTALVFVGVASLSPFLSRPVVRVLGRVMPRVWGTTGRLARENALRSPRRTAATASALMIGLALVSGVAVLFASITTSVNATIDRSVGADFIVTTSNFSPVPTSVAEDIRAVDGIAAVTSFRFGQAQVDGSVASLQGVQPDTVDDTLQLDVLDGDLAAMADGDIAVSESVAEDHGWSVGDPVTMRFGRTGDQDLSVGAVYADNPIAGGYLVGLDTYEENFSQQLDSVIAMTVSPDADLDSVRAGVEAATATSSLQVRDQSEFKAEQRDQINQLLGLVMVLLALAVLIALLGIVNTLALSVIERTREIGLLRAVGMTRSQVRRMVRLESVVIAVFGALLGLLLGLAFGTSIVSALADDGIDRMSIPYGQLVVYLVLGAVIGVVAAVWPARRASRLDVLRAITTE